MTSKRKRKASAENKDYSHYFTISDEAIKELYSRFESLRQPALDFYDNPNCTSYDVPVDGGTIKVYHVKPDNPVGVRPVVFVPGWSTLTYQFEDMNEVIKDRIEFYQIESREKSTSTIKRRKASMSVNQKAKDVQAVINYFELDKKDFVLFGSCWGAAIICQGLIDKSLSAPTVVTFAPMHKLWFNKFMLKYLVPLVPPFFISFLMKILPVFVFRKMKAKTQKQRILVTIQSAVSWKWRKAAIAAADFELFGKLSTIKEEVIVINGTHDQVHDKSVYPRFAEEMPNSRFFGFGFEESEREFSLGYMFYELAQITKEKHVSDFFLEYEKKVDRASTTEKE